MAGLYPEKKEEAKGIIMVTEQERQRMNLPDVPLWPLGITLRGLETAPRMIPGEKTTRKRTTTVAQRVVKEWSLYKYYDIACISTSEFVVASAFKV
jgi:hypothetical protein